MKKPFVLTILLALTLSAVGQKIKLKNGTLFADNQAIAKIEGAKNPDLVLVKDFTVSNLKGETLFTANWSDAIPEDPNDNVAYYYEFNFAASKVIAYLPIAKLGPDKNLGKLIVKNKLIKGEAIDEAALKVLIKKKGKTPPPSFDYPMVERNRTWPVELRELGKIEQNSKVVSLYTDQGTQNGMDVYTFRVPSGEVAAVIKFSGGNNANSFELKTLRDGRETRINLPREGKISAVVAIERNYYTIKLIAKWLVDNNYI